jgi:hypothetical protein
MESLSLLTGVFWKLYDDYADNKEAYSFLTDYELPIQLVVIVLSMALAFHDSLFLIYLIIIIISDCILYVLKQKDPSVKVNYAVDTTFWKVGGVFATILFLFRFNTIRATFTTYEYAFTLLGIVLIGSEIYSQFTTKKEILENESETHLFLEASNQKFGTRILELIVSFLFLKFLVLKYDCAKNFKHILLFSISYMYTSIISILYLKYHYFHLQGMDIFEK